MDEPLSKTIPIKIWIWQLPEEQRMKLSEAQEPASSTLKTKRSDIYEDVHRHGDINCLNLGPNMTRMISA